MFQSNITKEEINNLPLRKFEGNTLIIDTRERQEKALNELEKSEVVGFDTETKPTFKKGEKNEVALVQVSTLETAYLFRISETGISNRMVRFFENPAIVKLGIALEDDLNDLRRLRDFLPASFYGLEKLVKQLEIESNGLKKLAAIILGVKISKRAQVSNWEAAQLTEKQIDYAATDAWVCLEMFEHLKKKGWDVLEGAESL